MFSPIRTRIATGLLLLLLSAGAVAAPPYVPTLRVMELTDPARERTMVAWIWGPGPSGVAAGRLAGNSVFEPVAGSRAGAFAPGTHPLLLLFHGTSGNTRSIAWLAAGLASRGYIVVAANHPGSTTREVTQESMIRTWLQAEDGSFLLDSILGAPELAGSVDPARIGSIGFSLGGYSALAIAGARLDIRALQDFCRERPSEETCKLFPDALYGPAVAGQPQDRDLRDPLITAAVSLAPGFVPALRPASLETIDIPVLIVAGSDDEMLPIADHARRLAGRLPRGAYLELSYASHFSFLGRCTPEALPILAEEDATFLCDDPATYARPEIHRRVLAFVAAFLDQSWRP